MSEQVIILVNPYCHQGKGWKRWLSIKSQLLQILPHTPTIVALEKGQSLENLMFPLLGKCHNNYIISAGGDGSVHYLVNSILKSRESLSKTCTIGAIGLGSSNDFLKPFGSKLKNIPLRVNYCSGFLHHDVGHITYLNEQNEFREQYFIVNASIGVTAEANWNFNNPGKVLKFLKKYNTTAAILHTAVQTILMHKNTSCLVCFKKEHVDASISNINILKSPFVSGSFHYNQKLQPDDGRLGLNICHAMNRKELLSTLFQLSKGRFENGEKTISTFTNDFKLIAKEPVIFECDGETAKAKDIAITLVPGAIKIIRS